MKNHSRTHGQSSKTSYRTPSMFRSNIWRLKVDSNSKIALRSNKGKGR
ncbi:MAG: hypothetical protein WCT10_00065 [Patescibacteria group bacterium]|jgi:hypothetical protein